MLVLVSVEVRRRGTPPTASPALEGERGRATTLEVWRKKKRIGRIAYRLLSHDGSYSSHW